MKRLTIVILAAVILSLLISTAQAGDVANLKVEDALLVRRIRGYNQLTAKANIRRAEIQGILKWLAQKEAEAEAEKIKAEEAEEEKEKADAPSIEK